MVPVDKAGNNIALVCKRYYMEVISKEIENSSTFNHITTNVSQFQNDLYDSIVKDLRINNKLPTLYATAKMHKHPKSFRFITASHDTITSNLSNAVSKCLRVLLDSARRSYNYQVKHIDNAIFIVDNRQRVVDFMEISNRRNDKSKCISTWDFSTLYTTLPHNKLIDKISKFITKVFNIKSSENSPKHFVTFSTKSDVAYYTVSKSKTCRSFSCDELIDAVTFIINNSYIVFHNSVYQQIIGVPMGTNCAPYLANLFLHMYEMEYLEKLIDMGKIDIAKRLASTFRYQDDCIAINDSNLFNEHYRHIYPPEMSLECTNVSHAVCTFLDLRVSVYKGKFIYKSFDKRKAFDFKIVKYPNLYGNIPMSPAYGVFYSQLVRFTEINQSINSFISDIEESVKCFLENGYNNSELRHCYIKFCRKYMHKWGKFGVNIANVRYLNRIFKAPNTDNNII